MAKKDKFLLKDNGEPYRTADGGPLLLDQFDSDPSYNPDLDDRTLADVVDELRKLGIPVPDEMLKEHDHKFFLQPNGKPHRTSDGEPMRADFFEGDPYLDPKHKPLTPAEIEAEFRKLGLSRPDVLLKELNKEGKEY